MFYVDSIHMDTGITKPNDASEMSVTNILACDLETLNPYFIIQEYLISQNVSGKEFLGN